MTEEKIHPWEVRRPDVLLAELAERHPFDRPCTLLARVDGGYEQQRLTSSTVLWAEPADDEVQRTRLTEQALERLGFSRTMARYPTWPLAVPVVVRPGSAWMAWDETEALLGLRYGSNLCDVLQGDVLTVTARGWYSPLDELYGSEPRAAWAAVADEPVQQLTLIDLPVPRVGECLACFLHRVLARQPCDMKLTQTRRWQSMQRRSGARTAGLTAHLKRNAAFCDCEVLMNGYPEREQVIGLAGSPCPHPPRGW